MTSRSDIEVTRADRWIALALGVCAMATYLRSLTFGYVIDDTTIIRSNPRIVGWHALLSVWTQPYWSNSGVDHSGLYRPLLMAIFAAIWNGLGHLPFWFHLFAVASHVIACLLVWRLARLAVAWLPAAAAAFWFAVQPVHIEAVANVANSSEVLVAVWTLVLALWLWRSARQTAEGESVGWLTAVVAAGLFAAAFLTKESGAMAPALAGVAAWGWRSDGGPRRFHLRQSIVRWWRPLVAFGVTGVAIIAARLAVLGTVAGGSAIAAPGLAGLTVAQRIWSMLALGPRIALLLLWPRTIDPHYGPDLIAGAGRPSADAALTVLVVVGLFALGFWRAAPRRVSDGREHGDARLLVAVTWTIVAFIPASNLLSPTGQLLAERTLYGSTIGVALLLAWALERSLNYLEQHARGFARLAPIAVGALVLAIAIGGGIRTSRLTTFWQSNRSAFQQMIAADPADYCGYWLMAMYERNEGRADQSLPFFEDAYARFRRSPQLLIDYSETLLLEHQPARAAAISVQLMDWPDLRRSPQAVSLYLNSVGQAYGADSVVVAGGRLGLRMPVHGTDRTPIAHPLSPGRGR